MTHLLWQETDEGYELTVEDGRAVIERRKVEGIASLVPQIYDDSGEPIVEWKIWFPESEFESAEEFIIAKLIRLDKHGKSDTEFLELLGNTLEYAKSLLDDKPLAHHRRLENMRLWVLSMGMSTKLDLTTSEVDYETMDFDWHYENNIYSMNTEFGLVEIIEITAKEDKPVTKYQIRITDASGVTFTSLHPPDMNWLFKEAIQFGIPINYDPPKVNFADVEKRVRQFLAKLDFPTVDETHLDCINFLIDICLARFPKEETMHFVRLRDIMVWVNESLP